MTRWQRLRTFLWSTKAKVLLGILGVLVLARLALPWVLKTVINDRLAQMDGYTGRVLDVDVSLLRGAYTLDDLRIERIDRDVPVPFVEAESIDISLEWLALLQGKVVAELVVEHPVLNFVNGRGGQTGEGNDWRQTVDDLVPITINHLAIHDGEVHYRDFGSRPSVDVVAANLEVEATGLSTHYEEGSERLPAHVEVTSRVQRSGQLRAAIDLDPWDERPTFDLALSLEHLRARELNRFLRAYAWVDAEQGEFYCYSEISSRRGAFRGYVKPMVEHLSLFRWGEDDDVFHQIADLFVQLVVDLFENHGTDRFATRVNVSGTIDQPGVNGFEAVVGVLRNTFIEAFEHGLERGPSHWHRDRSRSPVN
ncbi:MAG: DUF748 domain-containing protein [Deltaproteobacteria bacterium]|nr:DUF748 domain-containing protein [Deltaproteobacteria bacterium]